jgi:hypothetical protein
MFSFMGNCWYCDNRTKLNRHGMCSGCESLYPDENSMMNILDQVEADRRENEDIRNRIGMAFCELQNGVYSFCDSLEELHSASFSA